MRVRKFMSLKKAMTLAAASWVFGPHAAFAASFDCAKASTAVEKMICANKTVSELDEYLGRYYTSGRVAVGTGKNCLASNQRDWLRNVRNQCLGARCLELAYLARLGELEGLQPGATALKNVELPAVKTLVWIIPEEEDTVAAPRDPKAPVLVAQGKIVDEIETGDGFVLQTDAGQKHLLLALMFMSRSHGQVLESLSHDTGARYEARGRGEQSADGSVHYAPGACTLIYRLPPEPSR